MRTATCSRGGCCGRHTKKCPIWIGHTSSQFCTACVGTVASDKRDATSCHLNAFHWHWEDSSDCLQYVICHFWFGIYTAAASSIVGRFLLLARWPGTIRPTISEVQRLVMTNLEQHWRHTFSLSIRTCHALQAFCVIALYKCTITYLLTYLL